MYKILILLILVFVSSCNQTERKEEPVVYKPSGNELDCEVKEFSEQVENVIAEEVKKDSVSREVKLHVKNPDLYSEKFINEIRSLRGFGEININDSLIVLDDKDTVSFPDVPAIGKRILLTGINKNLAVEVHIRRINYTTIKYKIEMTESERGSFAEEGEADLGPGFILGSEIDENVLSGLSYSSTEYSVNKGNCFMSLRLGYDEGNLRVLLGKLIKNCNGKIREISLDDFPNLVEK